MCCMVFLKSVKATVWWLWDNMFSILPKQQTGDSLLPLYHSAALWWCIRQLKQMFAHFLMSSLNCLWWDCVRESATRRMFTVHHSPCLIGSFVSKLQSHSECACSNTRSISTVNSSLTEQGWNCEDTWQSIACRCLSNLAAVIQHIQHSRALVSKADADVAWQGLPHTLSVWCRLGLGHCMHWSCTWVAQDLWHVEAGGDTLLSDCMTSLVCL